jgi:hypothetical protein
MSRAMRIQMPEALEVCGNLPFWHEWCKTFGQGRPSIPAWKRDGAVQPS